MVIYGDDEIYRLTEKKAGKNSWFPQISDPHQLDEKSFFLYFFHEFPISVKTSQKILKAVVNIVHMSHQPELACIAKSIIISIDGFKGKNTGKSHI